MSDRPLRAALDQLRGSLRERRLHRDRAAEHGEDGGPAAPLRAPAGSWLIVSPTPADGDRSRHGVDGEGRP